MCGRFLDWSRRGDAKFCSARCRQRDFRSKRRFPPLPVEVRRDQLDDPESVRAAMPPFWQVAGAVVWIEYVSAVPCFRCGHERAEVLGLIYRPGGAHRARAVFCGEDCLLDAVHAQRW